MARTRTAPWDYERRTGKRTREDDLCLAQSAAQMRFDAAKKAYDAYVKSVMSGNTLGLSIDYEIMDQLARAANEAEQGLQACKDAWHMTAAEAERDEAERDYRQTLADVRPGA